MGPMRIGAALLGLGGALFLTSGALAQSAGQPVKGGVLNVGFASDTKTLDPVFSIQFSERQALYLIFNTLFDLGTDFSIKPELARAWEYQDGGKRLVIKLREGVKFHDGSAFDATVVKWNLERRLDETVKSPQRSALLPIIASIDVIDPLTVAINLKQPAPGLLGMLAQREGFMLPPAAAEKAGADFGGKPVGSGPFAFKEWVRGSHIAVERNPNYWDAGKIHLDRIMLRDIAGNVVGVQRLLSGELDYVAELTPQDVRQLESRRGIRLDPTPVGRWISMQWQVDKPPFNNEKLRQAIAHAVDRKRINDIINDGKGTLAEGATPKALWWHNPDLKSYAHDPERAKALLREAGLGGGIEIALSHPGTAMLQQINQIVQDQLKAVGITVKLEPVAMSEWYARVVEQKINFTAMRWTQRPDPDGLLYLLFHSKGAGNSTNYKSAAVDALLDRGRAILDLDARKPIYREAQALITRDLAYLPLFFSVEYAAIRDVVQNHVWIPDEIPRFREIWKTR